MISKIVFVQPENNYIQTDSEIRHQCHQCHVLSKYYIFCCQEEYSPNDLFQQAVYDYSFQISESEGTVFNPTLSNSFLILYSA